jgi:hypothetical protein
LLIAHFCSVAPLKVYILPYLLIYVRSHPSPLLQLTITAMLTDDDVEQFLGESPAAPIAAAVGKQAGKGAAAAAATAAASAAASAAAAATGKEFTVRFAATVPCEVPLAPLVQFFDGGARDASVATPREQLQALDIVVKTLFSGTVCAWVIMGSEFNRRHQTSALQCWHIIRCHIQHKQGYLLFDIKMNVENIAFHPTLIFASCSTMSAHFGLHRQTRGTFCPSVAPSSPRRTRAPRCRSVAARSPFSATLRSCTRRRHAGGRMPAANQKTPAK